jgi:predicted DCC family thiol-disulfide oxidoreductase YuxK
MKTLKDHIILYDADCPMCKVYTHAFTTTGMLDAKGRAPYQDMPAAACPVVDPKRAVNEIALVNTVTGEVKYGIDSLFAVIAHSFPFLRPLFSFKPFAWLMRKLYAFISYNRKVIIPSPNTNITGAHTLQPAFRLRHRLAWLLFTTVIIGSILTRFSGLLTAPIPHGNPYREYVIAAGQIFFQGLIIFLFAPNPGAPSASTTRWDYLGNMMTISLAGALLLLPALAVAAIIHLPPALSHISPIIATGYFLLVAALMLLEHIRRTKLLSLGWGLTLSWVCYRVLVLLVIFS